MPKREGRAEHEVAAADQQDRQRAAEAGAGGHADDAGIDQRIAEQALQRRARNRQARRRP